MSIRKILVPASGEDGDAVALSAALKLAERFGAQIEALHVQASGDAALPFLGDTASGAVIEEIIDRIEEEAKKRAAKARSGFDKWREKAGLLEGAKPGGISASAVYRQETGDRDGLLGLHARCSDLIVVRAATSEDDAAVAADIEVILMGSGRPVLLVPAELSPNFANKVVAAWNDSVESARALAAALPLLEKADSVTVASVSTGEKDTPDLEMVSQYLTAHGIAASTTVIEAGDEEISDVLIQHARRHDGALLVMGAYSHSRLREQVLGGVTQDILDFTEIPVLLIH